MQQHVAFLERSLLKTKIIKKLEAIVVTQAKIKAHSICNLGFNLSNGSIYNYHFITKKLAKKFKAQFECLGKT